MSTAAAETIRESDHEHCGCCGRQLPKSEVTELGSTPGVFICVGCAIWAARRAGSAAALRQLRFTPLGARLRRLLRGGTDPAVRAAIPILPSADLDRTAAFYIAAGFTEIERHEGYLLIHNGGAELHSPWNRTAQPPANASSTSPTPSSCGSNCATATPPASARSPIRTTDCASSS